MLESIFKSSYPSLINYKRSQKKFYPINYLENKDIFVKSNAKTLISFNKSLEVEKKHLRDLQNEYLNLQFPIKLVPQRLFYGDAYLIQKALISGEPIDDIIKNHRGDLREPEEVNAKMNSNIDGKSVKEILRDFKLFWEQRQALLDEIYPLQTSLDLDNIKPKVSSHSAKDYVHFCRGSSEKGRWNLLWSDSLRYIDLYRPIDRLIQKKINDKSISSTPLSNPNEANKVKIFVAGLGARYEEVYDYSLYALRSLEDKNVKLSDAIDFEMVDFRPSDDFGICYINPPKVASLSDLKDPAFLNDLLIEHPSLDTLGFKTYPIKVLDFVANLIEDGKNLHTSTSLEKFSKNYKKDGYDFVSVNNILQYPGYGDEDSPESVMGIPKQSRFLNPFRSKKPLNSHKFDQYKELLVNVLKMVRPGGFLSCKIDGVNKQQKAYNDIMDALISEVDINKSFTRLQQGLYLRKECDK